MARVFKTVKKISQGARLYRKWAEYEVGDIVIGKLAGTYVDNYKKTCYLLEVEGAFLKDKKFAAEVKGKTLALNHTGTLAKDLAKLADGDLIQVEYQGLERMDGGPYEGKDKHVIEVTQVEEEGTTSEEDVDL
jgi:hypothetical protein